MNGAEEEAFYQKRAPTDTPEWMRTVTLSFPSGRTAEEIVVDDVAGLIWVVNLGCIELHPHPVRSGNLEHPDELRIDLDPGPGFSWQDVCTVALEVKAFREEVGLRGWPKTSGSRGMHVNVRIHPQWTFTEVRRAALALSRAIEKRVPGLATSKWWKEERHGVFLDYNQNAKDRTTCSAYSVRPLPDARVSTPLEWGEVPNSDPAEFTVFTVPKRFAERGDAHAGMDSAAGSLEELLHLADQEEAAGLGDAPWPPHFRKMEGEGKRVAPSRSRSSVKPARTKMQLIVIANSPDKAAALAGLERWKHKHAAAASYLAVDDVLVDSMRGRSSTWTRIRVNLRNVPESLRQATVPSLLLQPLVENSLRHGFSRRAEPGTICVSAEMYGQTLVLRVTDNGAGLAEGAGRRPGSGLGLTITRGRLESLYGPNQSLVLRNLPSGGAEARITLPFKAAPSTEVKEHAELESTHC